MRAVFCCALTASAALVKVDAFADSLRQEMEPWGKPAAAPVQCEEPDGLYASLSGLSGAEIVENGGIADKGIAAGKAAHVDMATLEGMAIAEHAPANNPKFLTYAWGPYLKDGNQLTAWQYNEATRKIEFFYAKPGLHRKDATNAIGKGMKLACLKLGKKCPDIEYQFPKKTFDPVPSVEDKIESSQVEFAGFGTFTLVRVNDRFKLQDDEGKCIIRVYVCGTGGANDAHIVTGPCVPATPGVPATPEVSAATSIAVEVSQRQAATNIRREKNRLLGWG